MSIKKQSEQQIYGRNDMIMLEQNNKIYGSLGLADRYVNENRRRNKKKHCYSIKTT